MTNAIMELLKDNNTDLYSTIERLGYYRNFATKSLEANAWTEDTLFGLASLFDVEYVQHFVGYEWLHENDERMKNAIKWMMQTKKISFQNMADQIGCTKQNISLKVNSNNIKSTDVRIVANLLGVEFESYFIDRKTGKVYR